MKERYQDIEDKNEALLDFIETHAKGKEFLERFEMSWIYHDSALEGVIYTPQELSAGLKGGAIDAEASIVQSVLEIRNHKAAVEFIRAEASANGKKQAQITLTTIKRIHDLLIGNTPEAQAARAQVERRERSERELAKERERSGFRKDMPLHRTYFHEIAQPSKIPGQLEKLVDYTAGAEFREFHPIKQAATVQHQFLQIFPFTEQSGKVARLVSNLILLRHRYLPVVIHAIDRQRYYESFRGPVANFRGLLMDAMDNSLENGLKYFRDLTKRYRAVT